MGSKNSKSEQEKEKDISIILKHRFRGANTYKNSHNYNESYSTSQNTETEEKQKSKKDSSEKKYPFKFEWKGKGKRVLLSGSFFDNWNKTKDMIKNDNTDIFESVVYLTKTKHRFKFIVDNKWICSNQYPTISDEHGITNNYIDLTNYFPPENLLKCQQGKKDDLNNLNKSNNKNNNDTSYNMGYNTKMPLRYDLNTVAPNIIWHYSPKFNLDYQSNQNMLVNKKYLKYKEKNLMTENNTYKKILVFPHEKLMHLCPNLYSLNNEGKNIKHNFIKISTTIRSSHKFLTIVYYRPKEVV